MSESIHSIFEQANATSLRDCVMALLNRAPLYTTNIAILKIAAAHLGSDFFLVAILLGGAIGLIAIVLGALLGLYIIPRPGGGADRRP